MGAAIAQTTDTGKTDVNALGLRMVYTTSYNQAEKTLPNIVRSNFNNDWSSVDLNASPIQNEITKFVSEQQGKMPGVDQSQIRQQIEAAFSAALFQLRHNSSATSAH